MRIFDTKLLIALLAASASLTALADEPVFSDCVIEMAGSSPVCVRSITQNACNERAASSNGKATWQQGKTCPGTEGDRGACMIEISGMTPSCIADVTQTECKDRAASHSAKGNWLQNDICPKPRNIQYDPFNGALILVN